MRTRIERRPWTATDDDILREVYPHAHSGQVATWLERSVASVYGRADTLGLRKTKAYLASPAASRMRRGDAIGAKYRFQKGHAPHNKGLRRPGWHAGRMKETQFKKGELAGAAQRKWVPIGTEVRDHDGYLKRKIADDHTVPSRFNWRYVHVLAWEAANGPVPSGHVLAFRNRDKRDTRLENLELISMRDNMRRNCIHNLPAPIADTMRLIGTLTRQIHRKEQQREKQDRRFA